MSTGLEARIVVRRPSFTLDVSITAAPGEVLAVLGPNGAGKSTLLGVLSGLLRPDEGFVRVGEHVVTDTSAGVHVPPHRRGVGLLAQQALLFPHLTALDNIAFGPRAHGVPRRKAQARAEVLLTGVDAAALGDRRPSQMSGGQQQRVALARALAPEPGLLLLDEPLAALDVDATPAMRALLRRVIRDGKQTAVLVTHSALDALVLADRVVVLTEGRVVEDGGTREVLARPRSPFTARIAGLDLIPGVRDVDGLRTPDGLLVSGRADGVEVGDAAVAVFPPSAVAVHTTRPGGSPRNALRVRLAAIEPRGDVVRLRAGAAPGGPAWADGLAADVTPAAVADLAVEPGDELWFVIKATEVAIHGAG
ncbi:sulfate/molybdate ABC transporter ATP-binding protein [Pseudonocardia abyssalis]|uniref:ATP-binding cassette domain-containing protein n=2 Tax=Pseudonocardia abyssalis TaxID=2792008 RepID=A0ABS6V0S2_9PSEU|nr:ATP-binding cassette domain-containing protein [Pseudonocardia abyssalis]MBW0117995.1 ATP-binding cassette domain-containing protein [Pseudonocardia abyssalis]MBW0137831.1 ATP-binding cassette domain-containing protein [Pseudonocardia abyssalis]